MKKLDNLLINVRSGIIQSAEEIGIPNADSIPFKLEDCKLESVFRFNACRNSYTTYKSKIYGIIEEPSNTYLIVDHNSNNWCVIAANLQQHFDKRYQEKIIEIKSSLGTKIDSYCSIISLNDLHSFLKEDQDNVENEPKLQKLENSITKQEAVPEANQAETRSVSVQDNTPKQESSSLMQNISHRLIAEMAMKTTSQAVAPLAGKIAAHFSNPETAQDSAIQAHELVTSDLGQGLLGLPAAYIVPKLLPLSSKNKDGLKREMKASSLTKIGVNLIEPMAQMLFEHLKSYGVISEPKKRIESFDQLLASTSENEPEDLETKRMAK